MDVSLNIDCSNSNVVQNNEIPTLNSDLIKKKPLEQEINILSSSFIKKSKTSSVNANKISSDEVEYLYSNPNKKDIDGKSSIYEPLIADQKNDSASTFSLTDSDSVGTKKVQNIHPFFEGKSKIAKIDVTSSPPTMARKEV
jgi:hypothetical protein